MGRAIRPDHPPEQLYSLGLHHGQAERIGLPELDGDPLQRQLHDAVSKPYRGRQVCQTMAHRFAKRLLGELSFDRYEKVGRGRVALVPPAPSRAGRKADQRAGAPRREGNAAPVDEILTTERCPPEVQDEYMGGAGEVCFLPLQAGSFDQVRAHASPALILMDQGLAPTPPDGARITAKHFSHRKILPLKWQRIPASLRTLSYDFIQK